jgi:hypothetical protein
MQEHRETVTYTPADETRVVTTTEPTTAHVNRNEAVAYDPYDNRRNTTAKMVQAVYLIFGLIEALIGIRFVLRLLGANPDAGFAQFIYGITGGFIAPFVGLFGVPQFNGSVVEIHSIVAIVVYALLAWLIARVVWLTMGETRSAVTTARTRVDTHVH